jgi:homoserine kinase
MQLLNESLTSAQQASVYEHRAGELLSAAGPTPRAVAEAQALATLAQSLRLADCAEWLMSIRDDGVGVG